MERYGNIYFYKPNPKVIPFHQDQSPNRNIHGNNGSGKSYAAGADACYIVTGRSPYREIKPPPFGSRVIWIVTTSFKIQKSSSQLILFSDVESAVRDIGLLPPLEHLESMGVKVAWEDRAKGILSSVKFPGCLIEFKSMEQQAFNMAGAAVDNIWLDEVAPAPIYDEATTRVLRKNGQVTMSFLLDDAAASYVVTDLYEDFKKAEKDGRKSTTSFYFLAIEDNEYLDPQEVKVRKQAVSTEGRAWRFSDGGYFDVSPKGTIIHENFAPNIHVADDLIDEFDSLEILYRCWDLGKNVPACMIWQLDRFNRTKIYAQLCGNDIQLVNFIDEVEALCNRLFPSRLAMQELIPHDARRLYDTADFTAEQIFHRKGLKDTLMIYIREEPALAKANELLGQTIKRVPAVRIDSEFANNVINCMTLHTRDDKTGKPAKHPLFSHITDNIKMWAMFMGGIHARSDLNQPEFQPSYPRYRKESDRGGLNGSSLYIRRQEH